VKNKVSLYTVILFTVIILLSFSGCTKMAMPNFYNGHYFMAGDNNCRRVRMISDTRIMCYTSEGKETGYRDAMTDQQLSMYRYNQQMRQQQSQQLSQSLQNLNNQLNYNNQQMLNRNNVYKFKEVGPYGY